jgi:hypothetical protein
LEVDTAEDGYWEARKLTDTGYFMGWGDTIMEAVDNALLKVKAKEINEASIQEGEKE